ncbi:T9SS type A sorting domain-containing protein [Flavivirga jejuensis]|uniref:T9SS type A sorting domain-containing protein n=1 Tax=Flavivirga jejuensis TaxID=870487 RepID=A0ABT8WNE0_9FLAO|nr:T9SS type A sorting domain-containing protein [Flavivirga jejuensis]MDO5974669.1 T9SS type A sorting domain-containing protein [Flavivirga jejuensis]
MKLYIKIIFFLGFCVPCFSQIIFNGAHPLLEDQSYVFNFEAIDATGRNSYSTIPIDGGQPCSGIGICELRIAWNDMDSQWEMLADDGNGGFSSTFLIFKNTEASTPNPPSLTLGSWDENLAITEGKAGGNLTTLNATFTGNVQDTTTLGLPDLALNDLVNVFPNPVNSILYIHSNKDITQVRIYDITGKEVLVRSNNLKEIDVSQLYKGLYFLNIKIDDYDITEKITIN